MYRHRQQQVSGAVGDGLGAHVEFTRYPADPDSPDGSEAAHDVLCRRADTTKDEFELLLAELDGVVEEGDLDVQEVRYPPLHFKRREV